MPSHHAGLRLAQLASALIIIDTVGLFMVAGYIAVQGGFSIANISRLMTHTPLSLIVYLLWSTGIAATAASLLTVFLYGYRERWFWKILITASFAWLVFPPMHTLIGLLGLILLYRSKDAFPEHLARNAPNP